jgi:hypothetical protein
MKSTEFTKKCPPATQDIGINLKNRQKAINEYGYGPLNPNEPNIKFWAKKMDMWQLDGINEAKKSLCGNCAAFDLTRHAINCIKKGIGSEAGDDPMDVIDAGNLGYCRFLKFKCAAMRTCDAWVVGGPLTDEKPIDESANLVPGNVAYHKKLNPSVWEGTKLRADVRYKLLTIAKRFVEYLDIPDFKLSDVILRGSLVNYNYTAYSDFDLHIVTDFTALDSDITEQFYMAKKKIWNDEHDIIIKGHEVELYIEDIDAENVSEGTYSVLDSEWLRTPKYKEPEINDRAVNAKARDLMTQINRARKSNDSEQIQRLQNKIKNMRQAGLDAEGEFSTENLAFKIIRNKGYLDRLYKAGNQAIDQELSLDERKKAKKKKSKRRYPAGGYYGYYWGGYNDNSGSDAGGGGDGGGGESIRESQARLDPEVEEFLDGLTPDDVGYDEVGDYIVHYEGFTDQCQDSEEYQNDPESVFNDVWGDFKRRMGDKDPINYGIVGEHDYPIVYSVFRK